MLIKLMVNKPINNSLNNNDEDDQNHHPSQLSASDQSIATQFDSQLPEDIEQHPGQATILIVDDTPNNLHILFSYLETEGFKVLLTEDGESALQIALEQIPDLILLDILMPEMDGFETCIRLKSQSSTEDIPIIFLTALSDTTNKVRGFELGGVDYITKPLEQKEVLARIQTHLKLQKMRWLLARQNKELQQRLEFEKLSHKIIDKIRDSFAENLLLQTATEELRQLFDLNSCLIELYDLDNNIATIVYESKITLSSSQGETKNIAKEIDSGALLSTQSSIKLVTKISQSNQVQIDEYCLSCPIFDQNGIIGNILLFRPVTEVFKPLEIQFVKQITAQCAIAIRQARLYQIANHQVEELAKLNQLKNDFLKTISHELKTPIANVKLATQTMEKLFATQENRQHSVVFNRILEIFQKSCVRQNELIDDLLTVCYINAQEKTVNEQLINLHFWVKETVKPYWQLAGQHQQKLILNLPEEELYIRTDPLILKRILGELLQNAFKYTPKNQMITIEISVDDLYFYLSVSNTGVEIALQEQKLIFDQFYRIPNNDPWQYGGTGLGLNLAIKLAEIINASLEVESNSQKTMFCLRFKKTK